jgi:hypothetical protein
MNDARKKILIAQCKLISNWKTIYLTISIVYIHDNIVTKEISMIQKSTLLCASLNLLSFYSYACLNFNTENLNVRLSTWHDYRLLHQFYFNPDVGRYILAAETTPEELQKLNTWKHKVMLLAAASNSKLLPWTNTVG